MPGLCGPRQHWRWRLCVAAPPTPPIACLSAAVCCHAASMMAAAVGEALPPPAGCPFNALPDALVGRILKLAWARCAYICLLQRRSSCMRAQPPCLRSPLPALSPALLRVHRRPEQALVCRRWWRCYLDEPSLWDVHYSNFYCDSMEQLDGALHWFTQRAQHTGRHIRWLILDCCFIGARPPVDEGLAAAAIARQLPQLLGCLSPGRLRTLMLLPAELTEAVAAGLQRLAPCLASLAFGSTACALPASRFCRLAGQLTALTSLQLVARHLAPSVLAAAAALPLASLQLESQAALPDTRQLSALTRLQHLDLLQSKHAAEPLMVPSVTALAQLTRLGLGASEMQVRCQPGCCMQGGVLSVLTTPHLLAHAAAMRPPLHIRASRQFSRGVAPRGPGANEHLRQSWRRSASAGCARWGTSGTTCSMVWSG